MRRDILIRSVAIFLLLTALTACFPVSFDGPYKGRVIDAETDQPIEGVVVLGVWYRMNISPGGTVHTYYDAQETVTDKNGDFEVKGLGLKILSNVGPMDVTIFKAGYSYIGSAPWASHKYEGGLMRDKAKVEGGRVILPIKMLAMEERKKLYSPYIPDGVYEDENTLLSQR